MGAIEFAMEKSGSLSGGGTAPLKPKPGLNGPPVPTYCPTQAKTGLEWATRPTLVVRNLHFGSELQIPRA